MKHIIKKLQSAINMEQQNQREKVLTPGLAKAIEIINQETANAFEYEFQKDCGKWSDVTDLAAIKGLIDAGYTVRRKRND